jgi:hypothetical protein
MHDLGYSLVRLDLLWAWFEPRPGDYNPAAFEQFDFLVSLAHRYQVYLHPSLFIGGEVGEAYWDVPCASRPISRPSSGGATRARRPSSPGT